MKCCICGEEIKEYGNNPYGALDEKGNPINWKSEDECCDKCNMQYVIPGRLLMIRRNKKFN